MKTVTSETFIRAETDRQFGIVAQMAGGVNRLYHFRLPTHLDKQNIVRMNRDTLWRCISRKYELGLMLEKINERTPFEMRLIMAS